MRRIALFAAVLCLVIACKGKSYSFDRPPVTLGSTVKDEYLGLYFQDRKIGHFHGSATDAVLDGKPVSFLAGDGLIRLDMQGEPVMTTLKEEIILDSSFGCLYFRYLQDIGDSRLEITGRRQDGVFMLRTRSGGAVREEQARDGFLPLAAAGFIVLRKGIAEGRTFESTVFAEALQKYEKLRIEVGRPETQDGRRVFPLKQRLGSIDITSYVLENGETFKEESLQGFTLKRLSKEEALAYGDGGGISYFDILSYSLIPAVLGKQPASLTEAAFELSGFDGAARLPATAFQTVRRDDGTTTVTTGTKPIAAQPAFDRAALLKPTTKIQSDAPEIVTLAREITAGAASDSDKARRIVTWVHKNIRKRLRDTSSALETLKAREGECEAHSTLTAALLRAAAIPSAVAGGIVYSTDNGGFLYHAWNEVLLDGLLVPVDATFGEFPANPTHVKLTGGDDLEEVIHYLGKLRIRVVSLKP